MANRILIGVREFADQLGMTVSVPGRAQFDIDTSDINLPGLQFAGHFMHFAHDRVQLAGNAEMTLINELDENTVRKRMQKFFSYQIPLIVIARGYKAPEPMAVEAKKAGVPILRSPITTTKCSHKISNYLDHKLAPVITRHGVLIDVYGVGVMLTGESGIGKSETALELIKRGHRLVADDVVELKRVNDTRLTGTAPELVRHLMELRGIGIIDVRHMYGVGSVMVEKSVDLVIELEDWDDKKLYDRLGLEDVFTSILDVKIQKILMPVRPGRNLAIIVEVAARNFRLKKMGYNAAVEFDRRLRAQMELED